MSNTQIPANSVWSSMNYTPPRGSSTSFECDGCGHHASYHNLDNPSEDAILAKWSAQEKAMTSQQQASSSSRNKRKRITSQPHDGNQSTITITDDAPETIPGAFDASRNPNNTIHAFSSPFSNRNGNQR
ncbi:unnamed protein product [Aureobasidium uvarum]|uniref:Uncharacterized protein n=1 Tax=Aureobasidium uvarum TaxID=2773716 RepID=A0A9N8KQY7_9PEZI|nr:unnamed protein product [Aureobasidium uvarum]